MKDSVTNFEYDDNLDSLYLYSGLNEDVMGVISFSNLIFDVGVSGKLVGLEIENASKLLNIKANSLLKISDVKIFVQKQGNVVLLGFRINVGKETLRYNYVIPKEKIALNC